LKGANPAAPVPDGQINYDAFSMAGVGQAMPTTPYNIYGEDHGALATASNAYFQGHTPYPGLVQPVSFTIGDRLVKCTNMDLKLQYHLYANIGPYRDELQPYQRVTHDCFMSESLREDFQKRAEAAHQVIPSRRFSRICLVADS
jgi:PAB-dependent poly(A)-specific ribonuclease subunit 3